jgi:hypothetical protein
MLSAGLIAAALRQETDRFQSAMVRRQQPNGYQARRESDAKKAHSRETEYLRRQKSILARHRLVAQLAPEAM